MKTRSWSFTVVSIGMLALAFIMSVQTACHAQSLQVSDELPPSLTINQAAGQYDPSSASPLLFTAAFNEPVTGFEGSDVAISGTAGATTAVVTDRGDQMVYTVAISGMTADGSVVVEVPAGAAEDPAGNQSLASTSQDNQVTYWLPRPTVTINQAAGQPDPTNLSPINFTVEFSEDVLDFDGSDITFSGSAGGPLSATVTGSGVVYNAAISGMTSSGTVILSIAENAAHNAAGYGNRESFSSDNYVTYDITGPSVTIDRFPGERDPTNMTTVKFQVQFNEAVADFTEEDVSVSGPLTGTSLTVTHASQYRHYVEISGLAVSGTIRASVPAGVAHDALGNPSYASTSTDNTVVFDNVAPTVTINQSATQHDPTEDNKIKFDIVFSEPVLDFVSADVTVTGTSGVRVGTVTGSGANYQVEVTANRNSSGTVVVNIAGALCRDEAYNLNAPSTSADNVVTYNKPYPQVTVNQAQGQEDPTSDSPINFTVQFSEPVTGFTSSDVTTAGTARPSTCVVTGSGSVYNLAFSGMVQTGDLRVTISEMVAQDADGFYNSGSTSTDNKVDYIYPGIPVTIDQASEQQDPTRTNSVNFTVVFAEPVADFTADDVTITGTAGLNARTQTLTGSGTTYNLAIGNITASGTVIARIVSGKAHNAAGIKNNDSTSTDNTITYDVVSPTVTINQASGQADPTSQAPVNWTVVFSEPVSDFTDSDLTISGWYGARTIVITGSGTTYNVALSGMTGLVTLKATIAAGKVHDAAGNANTASTSTDNSIEYDNRPVTVTINQHSSQIDPTGASSIVFYVLFSRRVYEFTPGDVQLSGTAGATTAVWPDSAAGFTVTVSGMSGPGTVIATVPAGVARDAIGNLNTASTSTDNVVTYSPAGPCVTINQASGQADPTGVSPVNFAVVFSEPVSDFAAGDVTVSGTAGGTKTATVTGSGTTYNVAVSGMTSSGTVIASILAGVAHSASGAASLASTSTDNQVTLDLVRPTVSINQSTSQSDPTDASPVVFDVVFSKPVADFSAGDVSLSGTAGATTAEVAGSGTSYSVSVSGMTQAGTVVAAIPEGAAHDTAGNGNTSSSSTDNQVLFDNSYPTVTIDQAPGQADPAGAEPVYFQVVFSEPITGFTTGDVVLSGTAGASAAVVTDSGDHRTFSVAVSVMADSGSVIATFPEGVAQDALGHPCSASTSADNEVTYNLPAPSVTIDQAADQGDPTCAASIHFTVVFSQDVTGFDSSDLTITGDAGAISAEVTGSGAAYDVAVSGMSAPGTVIAEVVAGAAVNKYGQGNSSSTSTDNVVIYDNIAPTVTIAPAAGQPDPADSSPIRFTVIFSDPVTDFETGDVALSGTSGATNALVIDSGDHQTFAVEVSDMAAQGTVVATVEPGVAHDAAGNANIGPVSSSVSFTSASPTVTINQKTGTSDPTKSSPIRFTVVFSESVTGFASSDVVVSGVASPSVGITGSGATYEISVHGMSGTQVVSATIPAGVAQNAQGRCNLASTSTDNQVTFDNTAPTLTINQADAQADPTSASPIHFTATFSEPVLDFHPGYIVRAGTAGANAAVVTNSGDYIHWDIAVSGMSSGGTVSVYALADSACDAAYNYCRASTSTDNEVTYEGRPIAVTINQASTQPDPTYYWPIHFAAVFAAAVNDFTSEDVALSGTAGATTVVVTDAGDHMAYDVSVTGMTKNGTVIVGIPGGAAHSADGSPNATSTSSDNIVTLDIARPVVYVEKAEGQEDPTNYSPIRFHIDFTDVVVDFTADDVTLEGTAGATTAVLGGYEKHYWLDVSGMTQAGTVKVKVPEGVAHDAAGNPNYASWDVLDNEVQFNHCPTVNINQAADQRDPTNSTAIRFTAVFSEPVLGFWDSSDDIVVSGTAGATVTSVDDSGDGMTFTITATAANDGTVSLAIPAGVVTDADENLNEASRSTDNEVTYDGTPPSVTITQSQQTKDPCCKKPITFIVEFSESVSGLEIDDFILSGTSTGQYVAPITIGWLDKKYHIDIIGNITPGTVIINLADAAAKDAAGNSSLPATIVDNQVSFDDVRPTVTINQAADQADPVGACPINFTVVFSKPVGEWRSGFVQLTGSATGTRICTVTDSGDHMTFTASVTGLTGPGTLVARVQADAATDAYGNLSLASTSKDDTVTFDNTAPTVTINQAAEQSDPAGSLPVNFTVVFSKPVTDFVGEDVSISGTAGATTAVVTGSGTTYNVAIVDAADFGTIIASIEAGRVHDDLGNPNTASTSTDNSVTYALIAAPANVSLTPSGGALGTSAMTFSSVYTDGNGFADIRRGYLLLNDSYAQTNALLLWYDRASNRIYLKNDSNTSWGTGYAPGTDVVLENTQGSVYVKDTSVAYAGESLTVNWRVALKAGFLVKQLNAYMYCLDVGGLSDGWELMGFYYNQKPQVVSIAPNNEVLPIDTVTTLTSLYSDPNGSQDLRRSYVLVCEGFSQSNAMLIWYDKLANRVYLKNDANTSWGVGYAPGTDVVLSNSQCEVYVKDVVVSESGNNRTVVWSFKLKPSQADKNLVSWMYVTDAAGTFDGWKKMGWHFTPLAPVCVGVTPSTGKVQTGTSLVFSTEYSDDNGFGDIYQCYLQIGQTGSLANAVCVLYDAKQGKVFLRNDAHTSWGTGCAPGTDITLENSQCIVYVKDIAVSPSGPDNLIIDWKITLKPVLAGKLLGERMYCRDNEMMNSAWKLKGYVRGQ